MFRAPNIDLKRRAPALGLIALYAYLAFHAFSGSQGVLSWMSYSDEASVLRGKLQVVQARHAELKSQVDALSSCLLYTSPSPRDATLSRMPSSA